ncbi:MAG: hypothetical protein ACLPYW_09180 [Acidimicrobiales bacterium]
MGVTVLTCAVGFSGCGRIIKAVINHATHGKFGQDETAVNALDTKMKSGESATFVATYVTTGISPATIKVAATPPKDFAFVLTPSKGAVSDLIQNSSGSYICGNQSSTGSGTSSKWTCTKLSKNTIGTYNAMKALYSAQYWIDFLNVYKYAGVTGVTITSSTKTVNGFSMQCIVSSGSAGATTTTGTEPATTFTVCVTSQGILGYVNVSSDSTAFELKNYSSSPPSSLYQTPAGATITTLPTVTTTTS